MDNMNRTEKSITSAATASGTSTMTTACQSTSRWIPSKPQSKSPLSIRGQRLRNTRGSMYARTLVSCGMPISRSDRRSWSSVPKVTSRIPASSRPSSLPFQQPSQQQQGLSSTERQSTKRPQQHWRIAVPPEVKATSGSGQTPTSSPASSEFSLTLHSTESLSPGVTLSTAECDGSFTPFGVGAETFSGIATEGKALDHFCYRNQSSAIPYSFQGRIDFSAHFSSQLELNIAQHSRQWSGNLDISPSEFMLYYKSNRKNMSGLTGTTADCYVPSESFPPIALRSHSKLGPSDSTLPGVHSRGESCRGKRKRPWSTQEDNFLLELVKQSDRISWVDISNRMGGRSAKQCRERYHNHLMEVNKGEWTEEEDRYIFEQQKMYGNKWAKIARELPGRSDAQVKNRFYAYQRRVARAQKRDRSDSEVNNPEQPAAVRSVRTEQRMKPHKIQRRSSSSSSKTRGTETRNKSASSWNVQHRNSDSESSSDKNSTSAVVATTRTGRQFPKPPATASVQQRQSIARPRTRRTIVRNTK